MGVYSYSRTIPLAYYLLVVWYADITTGDVN
jgi:hypothetical protein